MSTILVVDDQAESRRPIEKLLRQDGYRVVTAANAYEAIAAARHEAPDLMLLDVMIPPMDGLTFLMLLRDSPHGRDMPVILITGLDDAQTMQRAKDLGVREYLVKSHFAPDTLLKLVRKHLPAQEATEA